MTIFAWIAIGLLIAKVVLMLDRRVPSDIIGLGIIAVLLVTGTLPTADALACFSNESVVLVGALCVVVGGLMYSGAIQWVTENMYAKATSLRNLMTRMMLPAAVLSTVILSEAVVAIFVHVVRIVGKRIAIPPSKVLLPLGYAATLGSMCSLVSSPANLLIANLYRQSTGTTIGIFEPMPAAICCVAVGLLSILYLQKWLPSRKAPQDSFADSTDYTVELLVPTESDVVGETVGDSGLLKVQGGHLIEIVRFDKEVISPVAADEFLLGGDRLVYSGQINSILNLRKTHGLVNAPHHVFSVSEINKERKLQIAELHPSSSLIGKKISETSFEERNGIVLVAIARQGKRLNSLPRDIELRAGDTLLLEGRKLLQEDFSSELIFFDSELLPANASKSIVSALILILLVTLSALEIMPLLHSSMLAALLMVICRCCNITQAQKVINWRLLMVFAGSVCLGRSLQVTGITEMISQGLTGSFASSAMPALILIAVLASILTEVMANTLCAAIFLPIALNTASILGVNPMTFCMTVLIACNSAFCTPISSNNNILTYGPGSYRFLDYMRVGVPLKIIILVTSLIAINILYPL